MNAGSVSGWFYSNPDINDSEEIPPDPKPC